MFIWKLPSPSMSITVARGFATAAPSAAGRPKPIEPSPPLVIQQRSRSNLKCCAAHIWCWPTPVLTITSRGSGTSRATISESLVTAYSGRMRPPISFVP